MEIYNNIVKSGLLKIGGAILTLSLVAPSASAMGEYRVIEGNVHKILRSSAELPEKYVPETRTYVVQKGDNLTKIADKFYGKFGLWGWKKVYDDNREAIGDSPNKIPIGLEIKIDWDWAVIDFEMRFKEGRAPYKNPKN